MSIAGISASSWFNSNAQGIQNRVQQFQQNFQNLGQDLQSGNLAAAQTDFAALGQSGPLGNSTSQTQANSNNPVSQDFAQLSQDLQSGNLPASQQDFAKLQQDLQTGATQTHRHHHHHGGASSEGSAISQLFGQLGQALQSGNLSSAQQAYNTLSQDFQQLGESSTQTPTSTSPASSTLSVSI
jgi:outer membrane protein assembly factor BamD (BamD/ComL family)